MSLILDSLKKSAKSSEAGAGKNAAENKLACERALPKPAAKQAASVPLAALFLVCAVILSGSVLWWVLFNALRADVNFQRTTFNARMSALEGKLDAAGEKMEQLISQNENNASGLKAGMLAIEDTKRQLADLSSAVEENKKAQEVSVKELGNKLEMALVPQEKKEAAEELNNRSESEPLPQEKQEAAVSVLP